MTLPWPFFGLRFTSIVLLSLTLASCHTPKSSSPAGMSGLQVAPEFKAFWLRGGGLATYGPPISVPWREGGRLHQTFVAAEMVFSTTKAGGEASLVPLGRELGLAEPPAPPVDGQAERYDSDTGHTIYAGFANLYRELGGKEVAGAPITEVQFRDGQVLQYFENLGLYRPENASPTETRLVALGLTSRSAVASSGFNTESVVLPGLIRQRPFASFLERYGGASRFGQPVTKPYFAEDGALEQVYERAVVFSPDGSAGQAAFRPLGSWLGPADEPASASQDAGAMYFEETGHNVLWAFAVFFSDNHGRTLLGLPLGEATLQEGRMVQRFENGILVYDFNLPPRLAVQLAPLGLAYLQDHPAPTAEPDGADAAEPTPATGSAPEALRLEATLGQAVLLPQDEQTLSVRVTRPDGSPVSGATVLVHWTGRLKEGKDRLPDSDDDGRTTWRWQVEDATAGEILNVFVVANDGEASGTALLQYLYGFPSSP